MLKVVHKIVRLAGKLWHLSKKQRARKDSRDLNGIYITVANIVSKNEKIAMGASPSRIWAWSIKNSGSLLFGYYCWKKFYFLEERYVVITLRS